MNHDTVWQILLNTVLPGNFVLAMFLGMCPFLGVSQKLSTAFPMGLATAFVIMVASLSAYFLNILLVHFHLEFLSVITFITVIAGAVQLVEMFVKKYFPVLFRALGIYLPLITTNCAVLGVALFQTARQYDFVQSVAYSAGGGAGFTLALILMAGLRERLQLADVPQLVQGAALSLMLGGLLSLAFMGFAGIGGGE
ncbi:electron transport complex protein RnfA [Novimethylophilus kurashikiensis]|uniref:Electron transport complex protein RnfA n=1 Tax=Novimethylophilus kurashikiensis TaxID=1825523 RepID=A0A2R5F3U8_9PROT|nr:Rnf-Nqr domain containing protein [Novimethylophilus kurashikiensis]GBG13136.1 electron transport complex protein RnfA [Novimethylophilus kurashikiensis]